MAFVMAAVDTGEGPAALLEDAAHPLAGNNLHGAVRVAGQGVVVGDGESPLGGLAEVGANLVKGLTLGVTSGKCGD